MQHLAETVVGELAGLDVRMESWVPLSPAIWVLDKALSWGRLRSRAATTESQGCAFGANIRHWRCDAIESPTRC